MIQKIKNKLLVLASIFILILPVAAPAGAFALSTGTCTPGTSSSSNDCIQGGLCNGANNLNVDANQDTCSPQGTGGVNGLIKEIINVLSVIVGVVAVIMIIWAGFRYITSGGKQESVTSAKNTILYAVIGLVIVALAQVIVRFVLTKTTTASQ
jgi:hypothetical protein